MKKRTLAISCLALIWTGSAFGQSTTSCQWIGNVWTCNNSAQQSGIDWSILRQQPNQTNDSFSSGLELGRRAREARIERERLELEQERLELERQRIEQERLESERNGASRAQSEVPDYIQAWFAKASPRMGLYSDFSEVVFESEVSITPDMIRLMSSSDYAADIAYYLGTHKAEARAIAMLPLLDAARAIDDIEGKVIREVMGSTEAGGESP